jgi:hypothetical protein
MVFVVTVRCIHDVEKKGPVPVVLFQDGIKLECKLPNSLGHEPGKRDREIDFGVLCPVYDLFSLSNPISL